MERIWSIVAAAGSGIRLGARIPKALVRLGKWTILEECLSRLADEGVVNIVVALPADTDFRACKTIASRSRIIYVPGGDRRQDSVLNAAMQIPDFADVVLIHDAARPFLRKGIVGELHASAMKYGAAVPVLPCADTLKRVSEGVVTDTVSRNGVFAVQTPQAFRLDVFNSMLPLYQEEEVTDDCAIVERLGFAPHTVTGSSMTFKITTPDDLELAKALIREEN